MSSECNGELPSGWIVRYKKRLSGATAGSVDKYYVDPDSGKQFRSKKEVFYFIKNGRRPIKGKQNSYVDTPSKESSKKQKATPDDKEDKKQPPGTSRFGKIPDSVTWVLKDASKGLWSPFVEGKMAHESSRNEWNALTVKLLSKPK